METDTNNMTLDELLMPLVELLNTKCSEPDGDEYLITYLGEHGLHHHEWVDQVAIELPWTVTHPESARVILTIVERTGSWKNWQMTKAVEQDPLRSPLRFRLSKHSFFETTHMQTVRYLVVDHCSDELHLPAAQVQLRLLEVLLNDDANLVDLHPDFLELF